MVTRATLDDVRDNERTFEQLRPELEANMPGNWVVIAAGTLLAAAPTLEEALRQAGPGAPATASRLVRKIGQDLPQTIRKL